jgi:hypothetical protein
MKLALFDAKPIQYLFDGDKAQVLCRRYKTYSEYREIDSLARLYNIDFKNNGLHRSLIKFTVYSAASVTCCYEK